MFKLLVKRFKYTPIHLVLWLCVWLFYIYFFSYNDTNTSFAVWFSTALLPVTIATSYVFSLKIIPNYLLEKKYILFALYTVYTVIISLFLILLIVFFGFMMKVYFNTEELPLLMRNVFFVFILVYVVVGLHGFINVLQNNFKSSNRNKDLENQLLEGKLQLKQKELYYLKQQIHPHFLFNTLNTVYALALKESKETPELILKLSNLLDFILNQIDKPTVSIFDEIQCIESYLGLEQMRFKDSLSISFEKNILHTLQVPPMLLMSFVENAFKHGGKEKDVLTILIQLSVNEEQLSFCIENSLDPSKEKMESHGLGIQNSKKRLEALYPNKYEIQVIQNPNKFQLHLFINHKDIHEPL